MTKGQERRLAKKKEAERAKRAALSSKIIGTAVSVLILAAIVFGIAYGIFSGVKAHIAEKERLARLIPVVDDYGTGLNADGTVAGINPDDYISLTFDPNEKITIPYADIEFSDEDIHKFVTVGDIVKYLEAHAK